MSGRLTKEQRAKQRSQFEIPDPPPLSEVPEKTAEITVTSCGLCFETRACLIVPVDGNPYESAAVCEECTKGVFGARPPRPTVHQPQPKLIGEKGGGE